MTAPRPIVFIDTETTSLRPDRRAWEIAVIVRRDGHPDHEQSWLIATDDLDLGNADPASLRFGGFYDRHPQAGAEVMNLRAPTPASEAGVLRAVEALTRGAVLHGSNPGFDTDVLGARMRANGICPSWHYHPEDVPTLAHGWLLGAGKPVPRRADGSVKSDDISLACGVDPDLYGRHTALGDCRWMRALYDLVTGREAER